MRKTTTILATGAIAIAFAAPLAAQDEAAAPLPSPDTVVATVNGQPITLGEMIITRAQLPPQYLQLPDEVLFQGVLDQLVQQQLFAGTMTEEPARVTLALAAERRSLMAGEAVTALLDGVVTDESLQTAYDAAFAAAEPVTEWNAAHILVATEEEARAVLDRIAAGEAFADLARELSTDVGSGANGGDLGWFGPGMMVAPFEAAVAALEVGAVSEPVETQFGWHLVTLADTREQQPPSLDQVRSELAQQIQREAVDARLAELMEGAEIVMPEADAFDPSLLSNLDVLEN